MSLLLLLLACKKEETFPTYGSASHGDTATTVVTFDSGGLEPSTPDEDGDGWTAADCDDDDPAVHPGAGEECDGLDNDCDNLVDEDVNVNTYYFDADGDSWGLESLAAYACEQPAGHTTKAGDCDDDDQGVHPNATDAAGDGIDQDCDGTDG